MSKSIQPFSANFLQAWLVGLHIDPLVEYCIFLWFHLRRSWTFCWYFEAKFENGWTVTLSRFSFESLEQSCPVPAKIFLFDCPLALKLINCGVSSCAQILVRSIASSQIPGDTSFKLLQIWCYASINQDYCQLVKIFHGHFLCAPQTSFQGSFVLFLWLDLRVCCMESTEEGVTNLFGS